MTKDYYKILDIPEFSSSDEIKSAYRKLARKWHPDVAGSTPDVIQRFKEINEAYEILSDNSKKTDYDKARRFYSYAASNSTKQNNSYQSNATKPNFKETTTEKSSKENFWKDIFKSKEKESYAQPQRGENIYSDIEITVSEAINGTTKVINMLQTQICPKCGGRKFINGTQCTFCKGKGESSTYKRFSVKIPAGIKNNSKIRLAEEGEKGINGGKNGDLYLTVHVKEPNGCKTDGLNILKTVSIAPYEAVLGATISLETPTGNINLKISPNTKNGQKIRLSGCGIKQKDKIGDMIVTVEIQIPLDVTEEEKILYQKLSDLRGGKRVF